MRFLAILLFLPSLAFGGDWTKDDTLWQLAYTGVLAMDCAQTRWGASHPKEFQEGNKLIGPYPSKGKIDNICLGMALGHFGVSYALPLGYRRFWQFGSVMIEATVVFHNASLGVKMEF